jgi:hypothetical protein
MFDRIHSDCCPSDLSLRSFARAEVVVPILRTKIKFKQLTRSMRRLVTIPLALLMVMGILSPLSTQTCGPDPVPAPAAAWGYSCEVFWDHFTSISTVDVNDTRAQGFKWYVHNHFPGLASGAHQWQVGLPTRPGDVFLDPRGEGLTLRPTVEEVPSGGGGRHLESCATNGIANQYVGTAILGAAYFRYEITSTTEGTSGAWWPAGWTATTEFLMSSGPYPSSNHWPELDIFEAQLPNQGRYIHDWLINSASQTDSPTPYGASVGVTRITYGTLVVPPELNGGTGFVRGYVNDTTAQSPTVTFSPGGPYSSVATQHHCIVFTSGLNQPLIIKSVQVFAPGRRKFRHPPQKIGGFPQVGWGQEADLTD